MTGMSALIIIKLMVFYIKLSVSILPLLHMTVPSKTQNQINGEWLFIKMI